MAKGVAFRTNILPNLIETDLKEKKLKDINQNIKTRSATKIQALAKGVNFRTNVLPNLIETDLEEQKLKDLKQKVSNNNTTNAINVLTDAIKYRRARRALNVELKRKKREVYETLKDKYKPIESFTYKRLIINRPGWNEEKNKKKLKTELNNQIEIIAKKRFAVRHILQNPL